MANWGYPKWVVVESVDDLEGTQLVGMECGVKCPYNLG